jgi:hypothetical protein
MNEAPGEENEDPRDTIRLLRRLRPLGDIGEDQTAQPALRPPMGALCEKCRGAWVSSLPYFCAGNGLAYSPIADDIYCQRCGHVGPPDFA